MYLFSLILTSFVLSRVLGTLTPSGSVSIDCGGQHTFTCTVAAGTAGWTITGLMGITAAGSPGVSVAAASARVTTPDTALTTTSTITITGFNTSENGETVQCVVISATPSVEGVATISIGVPSCSTNVNVTDRSSDFSSATITWDQPTNSPPVTSYDVTCNSSCTAMPCTSGSSTCRVLSVSPCEDYSVTVLPMNSCGSSTGCTENSVVVPSQGVPSCPANVNVIDRSSNFSSATITWEQPTNSPSVTSYDVTCNPSCTAMPCTSGSSTCRVLSLSPCEDYSVTVLPMNSCGNSTGCTENIVAVPSQGPPQCGLVGVYYGNDSCPSFTFTPQGNVLPSTVVVSYQLVGDPSSARSLTCDYPIDPLMCELVVSGGTYTVRLTPQNNCGSPSSTCPSFTQSIPDDCRRSPPPVDPPTDSIPLIAGASVGGVVVVVVVGVSSYGITILIMGFTCYSSLGFLALLKCLCCPCSEGKARKSSSKQRIDSESPVTPPAQPPAQPPSDEYADPQAIRDRKEKGKEDKDKIQYAAIDFSAGAGSGAGEVKIHQKEEPVIYTTVQHV